MSSQKPPNLIMGLWGGLLLGVVGGGGALVVEAPTLLALGLMIAGAIVGFNLGKRF